MTFLQRLRKSRKKKEMPKDNPKFKKECRYPFGTPGQKDFYFCCKEALEGRSPYCKEHTELCYLKESKTNRRNIVGILPQKRA